MRICLLVDKGLENFNPSNYLQNYQWGMVEVQFPIIDFVRGLATRQGYDVYLNLFEGFDDGSGADLVKALESLNLPFTGADSTFFEPTRERMQTVAEANGISFARGFHAVSETDLAQAKELRYPLIVKHPSSSASEGLTPKSRVDTFDQLNIQFSRMASEYNSARVEEFIEGRELSCLVVDNPDDLNNPYAYPPAEVQFPAGETFLYEELKWISWDIFIIPINENVLVKRIQEISKRMYLAMHGKGYARIDFRLRPDGELVILEINANCGILYTEEDRGHADLPIMWDKDGHDGFLDRIFRSAILRRELRMDKKIPKPD